MITEQQVVLAYRPSMKVAAGEKLACEPVYFGVYRQGLQDKETKDLPLRSESEAMVAMTSAILGPPRHGLVPMACGWDSEMNRGAFRSRQDVDADMKSIDFLRQCGVDWLSDSHPWGGETGKMNSLVAGQPYQLGELVPRVPGTCPSSWREGRDVRYAQQQSSLDGRQTFSSGQTRMAHEDCKGGLSGERDHPEGPGKLPGKPALPRLAHTYQSPRARHGLLWGFGHRRRLLWHGRMVYDRDSSDLHVGPARSLARRLQLRLPAGTPAVDRQPAPTPPRAIHLDVSATDGPGGLVAAQCRRLLYAPGGGHASQPNGRRPDPHLVAEAGSSRLSSPLSGPAPGVSG